MTRFQFPLDKVIRWRAIQFAAEETQLKRLVQERLRLQMLGAQLGGERSRLQSAPATLPDLRGDDLRSIAAYALRLRRQAESLRDQQKRCERDLAAQTKKYNDARQRLRLLEELREKKLVEWRYEEGRELELLATESYLATWNRDQAD